MGNSCIKADKDVKPPTFIDSLVKFKDSGETGFSKLNCPIENLKILDAKKKIEENYPFTVPSGKRTQGSLKTKDWKKITLPNEEYGQHWLFSDETDRLEGYGILYYQGRFAEYVVEGEFKNNTVKQKQSYLKIFKDGSMYMGPLNDNFDPTEYGELLYENGNRYIGHFSFGLPHGEGELTTKYSKFVGQFSKGEKEKGVEEDKHGRYEGLYRNSLKEGEGVYVKHDGEKYVGQFSKNKKSGFGKLYDKSGSILYEGLWKNNSPENKQ